MRFVIRLCIVLAVLSASVASSAQDVALSVEGGRSYAGEYFGAPESAPAVFGEAVFGEHAIGQSNVTWRLDVIGGWIDGRDIPRFQTSRYTTRDHIWLAGVRPRFQFGAPDAWYRPFFFSFQPSLHTGRTHSLSSSYEFTSTLGWQMHHWMIAIRHSSNAFLHEPNLGETALIVGLTFRL
jgi:hypothetical protein